jgi:hypothetical protein
MAGSRRICCVKGLPQCETPFTITRIGHRSQILARAGQSTFTGNTPICRNFAEADFAAARERRFQTGLMQVTQATDTLSDNRFVGLDAPGG